jgi:hypothetical protein
VAHIQGREFVVFRDNSRCNLPNFLVLIDDFELDAHVGRWAVALNKVPLAVQAARVHLGKVFKVIIERREVVKALAKFGHELVRKFGLVHGHSYGQGHVNVFG